MQVYNRRARLRRLDRGLAISSGVIGRYSDMLGVWMAPVTAQLMMILAMAFPPGSRMRSLPCTGFKGQCHRNQRHPVSCPAVRRIMRQALGISRPLDQKAGGPDEGQPDVADFNSGP